MSLSNTYKPLIILAFFCFGSSGVYGMEYPIHSPVDRFESRLTELEQYLTETAEKESISARIDYLSSSGIRDLLTELENLFWLYAKQGPFKPYYKVTKRLEDHISHSEDYARFYAYVSHADPATERKYWNKLKKERAAYEDYLRDSDWLKPGLPLIAQIRETLQYIDWHSPKKDRQLLLKRVAHKIDKIRAKQYNFNLVEEGWHELRRNVRRFEYLNNAMDDLVMPSSEMGCPLTGTTATDHPDNSTYTCPVSACLLNKLTTISNELGDLKSAGARLQASGNEIPKQMTNRVSALHAELMDSKVYTHLIQQLRDCADSH